MKKIFIILLCIVFILSAFASCDQAEENKTDISENVSETVSEALPEQSEEVSEDASEASYVIVYIEPETSGEWGYDLPAIYTFYEDEEYSYFFGTISSASRTIVKYSDGTTQTIGEALNTGKITIEDLDRFGIEYGKEPK
ncbi:MAG: hypothetical protein IKM27_04545 [Clostridia bacterium]|nr:hypothetical protein [Clostridia bacterium]